LQSFRELGIEIHNAYGLTEAPLVTINQPGANRLGTSGQLLPSTEIRLDEDGEILVRGPQVTSGYFDPDVEPPFRNGWLCSGDLGRLTPEGALIIEGRKKELIATSYGKKIQISRVETLLQQIPQVAEAMVVGEGRPYCAALLWVSDADSADSDSIDQAVLDVNLRLSQPEQVRRWAILSNDLSIEGGDLTANLKLKRQAVTRRYQPVIEALYGGGGIGDQALHLGGAPRDEPVPA
jgi:long-chain acyl-CoA synthetase